MSDEREELARVIRWATPERWYITHDECDRLPLEPTQLRVADAVLAHLRARGWREPNGRVLSCGHRDDEWIALAARAESAERALDVEKRNHAICDHHRDEANAALTSARLEHAQLVGEWERYREALQSAEAALKFVADRADYTFAECTLAEQIVNTCKDALAIVIAALTPPSPFKG